MCDTTQQGLAGSEEMRVVLLCSDFPDLNTFAYMFEMNNSVTTFQNFKKDIFFLFEVY